MSYDDEKVLMGAEAKLRFGSGDSARSIVVQEPTIGVGRKIRAALDPLDSALESPEESAELDLGELLMDVLKVIDPAHEELREAVTERSTASQVATAIHELRRLASDPTALLQQKKVAEAREVLRLMGEMKDTVQTMKGMKGMKVIR